MTRDDLPARGDVAPLIEPLVKILAPPDAASGPTLPEGDAGVRRLILIVEDDPQIRALAATLLEETRLEIVEAASAEAALAVMERRGGEVVMLFVDIGLIGAMDGVDLARGVATLWPRTTIVVTSGAAGDRLVDLPDAVAFLPKPWRGLDVLMQVEKALRRRPPAVG